MIRANNEADFCAAADRIRTLLAGARYPAEREKTHNEFIQVETYIPGREFAVEGIVTNGRLHTLAIFDKPDPLEGPFFEETLYMTPSRESAEAQAQLIRTTQDGVRALGLTDGPVHAEMRYNDAGRLAAGDCGQADRRALRGVAPVHGRCETRGTDSAARGWRRHQRFAA